MKTHPAADIFPLLTGDEFATLKADIEKHGQREPVWMMDDAILDGRNRWRACHELGRQPQTRQYAGSDPVAFVLSLNLHRRHLSPSQLAFVALEIEKVEAMLAKERQVRKPSSVPEIVPGQKGEAREKAASAVGVNPRYVSDAKSLKAQAPDLAEQTYSGRITLPQAKRQLAERTAKQGLERPASSSISGLHRGDFRALASAIPDESAQLVFTDPPYDRDSLPLYEAAAKEAARILRPGGSMICYVGQVLLPEVLPLMSKHLRYWWTAACVHEGGNQMMQKLGIRCGWKPILWFVKVTRGDVANVIVDTVSGAREKDAHEWQQAEAEAAHFISGLTSPGGLVVDFFAGGGTTCVVAEQLRRQWAAFEVDARHYESAAARLTKRREAA